MNSPRELRRHLRVSAKEAATPSFHNTVHISGKTCDVCRGALLNNRTTRCDRCATTYGPSTADRLGSMIYGCKGLQSGDVMHRYKQPQATPDDLRRVGDLTALGLQHRGCADALVGIPSQHWATVPSLKTVGAEHPFRRIVAEVLGEHGEITVAANGSSRRATAADRREVQPGFYDIRTPVPDGSHVMVIDDTWTSGGHALSVAKALKRAGASKVSVLVIARWLDPRGGYPKWTYTNLIRGRAYDPFLCPWTAAACPAPLHAPVAASALTDRAPIPWPGFSWDAPGRIAPACRMIVDILSDGAWHQCADITARVAPVFELQPETVSKLLQGMVKTGGLARREPTGRRKRGGADIREVSLNKIDPMPDGVLTPFGVITEAPARDRGSAV